MPTKLPFTDLESDGSSVKITGSSARTLAQALINKPAETYAEMGSSFGIVRPSDISISDDGSLIINDPVIAGELANRKASANADVAFFDTNCSCKKEA